MIPDKRVMTDEEYKRFLAALAGKHLMFRPLPNGPNFNTIADIRGALDQVLEVAQLLRVLIDTGDNTLLPHFLSSIKQKRPVDKAVEYLDASGILDALDDAQDLVFGELRRAAIPKEDEEFLRRAGYSADEIEVLMALAISRAQVLASYTTSPSAIAEETKREFDQAMKRLMPKPGEQLPPKKKRKILNGAGKILGGAVAGIGNVLLATGTIAAPNPATGYAAIASGGVAVSSFFAGLGDLRGE